MSLKIAITINTTWNIYNFRLGLLKELQKQGNKIIALAPTDSYVNKFKKENIKFYPISINSKGINPVEDLVLIKNYVSALKKIKPDIVLSYTIKPNIYASIACRFLKILVINNVSGLGTLFIKKSIASYIAQFLYRFAFKKSSWIFFQNETDKNVFLSKKLVSPLKTSVLPGSGVNINYFKTERAFNKGKKILFVGRLLGDKGIREFIQAANRLSDEFSFLEFLLVGELGYNNEGAKSSLIIVERYLEDPKNDDLSIDDYKFFCFYGKVEYLVVDVDRYSGHKRNFYTKNWKLLDISSDCPKADKEIPKPEGYSEMINVVEKLSAGFPFVRVDLYNIQSKILFEEMIFYPWSGYVQFNPDIFDFELGEYFNINYKLS